MIKIHYVLLMLVFSSCVSAKIYQCMDATGQRIFSDKPCQYTTTIGEGTVSSYEGSEAQSLEQKKVPQVVDDQQAAKIRYHMTPSQARAKFCTQYSQSERDKLIASKQVVLGMSLGDVIKVWGAPLSSDGNKVLFQDGDDEVTVSLIEGCVINIERNLWQEDYIDAAIPLNQSL